MDTTARIATNPAGSQQRPNIIGRLRNGVLGVLRNTVGWPGPEAAKDTRAEEELEREHVKAGPAGVKFPNFLPYFDDQTGESAGARAAYRKMLADPNVKAAVLGKLLAVMALDLQTTPANEEDDRDEEIAAFTQWTLTERLLGGVPELVWNVLVHALIDGFSVNEKIWELEDKGKYAGKAGLVRLRPKDPVNDVVIETDQYRNVVNIRGLRWNGGEDFDPRDFVIYTHMPLYANPTGMSDFRAAYSRYWLLDTTLKLRASGIERRALPLLLGTYKNETQKPSLDVALAAIKSSTNWMSAPEGCKVEAINIAASSDDVYANAIKDLKHDIFLAIEGAILQALEGETTDGRGDSKVHRSSADKRVWHLARCIDTVLNNRENGLIRDIVDLNYVVTDYPKASLTGIDQTEIAAFIANYKSAHDLGIDLSIKQFRTTTGLSGPDRKNPADKLPGAVAPPAGAGNAGMDLAPFADAAPAVAAQADFPNAGGVTTSPASDNVDIYTRKQAKKFVDAGQHVALAGPDGTKATQLLRHSVKSGTVVLGQIARQAVGRLLASGPQSASALFTDDERQKLSTALAATNATAELLGRTRVRERQRKAEAGGDVKAFAEEHAPFEQFDDQIIQPMQPVEALRYFLGLTPRIGVDPARFGPAHERDAFTLAAATEETLLQRIQRIIGERLETGQGIRATPKIITEILDQAGLTPANPGYGEMVFRTNMMDSYTTGTTKEMQQPDVAETFPVWKYAGIRDGRQGEDHAPHFDHYFSNAVAFAEVRDSLVVRQGKVVPSGGKGRPFQCRCAPIPISKYAWRRLQAQGAVMTEFKAA